MVTVNVKIEIIYSKISEIMENGCYVTPKRILKALQIRLFTCDMPGRSFVKGVKGFQSLYGCDKCNQKFVTIRGKMTIFNCSW